MNYSSITLRIPQNRRGWMFSLNKVMTNKTDFDLNNKQLLAYLVYSVSFWYKNKNDKS